jgi:hypothetical protein
MIYSILLTLMQKNNSLQLPKTRMISAASQQTKLALSFHVAVDHPKGQGVGIGVVQQARCEKPCSLMPELLPTEERRYGIRRKCLATKNVKTRERAEMLALLHALGFAYSTIKKRCSPAVQVQTIKIFCEHLPVIYTVKRYLQHSPACFEDEVGSNDRARIKRVVQAIHKLERRCVGVFLTIANMEDDAQKRAGSAARQRGKVACQQRRRLQRARKRASAVVHRTSENELSAEVSAEDIPKLTLRMQACAISWEESWIPL